MYKLIQQGESGTVEFKRQFPPNASEMAKEIAALANTKGGFLFIGVDDDGKIVGVQRPDSIIQRVTGVVRQSCDPPLHPQMQAESIQGKTVIVIQVQRSGTPVAVNGKFYIRVGTSVVPATSRDLTKLLVRSLLERIDLLDMITGPFEGFAPENLMAPQGKSAISSEIEQSEDIETERIRLYEHFKGVFLVHRWLPSVYPGQKADIVIHLVQHNEGPLTEGLIETVDYYLGPKFPGSPYHKTNTEENFALHISAYAPMLCLAKVNLKNGDAITIYRYCDFPLDLNVA